MAMPVYIWDLPTDLYGEMIIVVVQAPSIEEAEAMIAAQSPSLLLRVRSATPIFLAERTGPQMLVYEARS